MKIGLPSQTLYTLLLCLFIALANLSPVAAMPRWQGGDARFTLTAKQTTLMEVFRAIKQQTGFQMFFSHEQINEQVSLEQKIDVSFNNMRLDDVLRQLFKGKPVQWSYRGDAIVLWVKKKDLKARNKEHISDSVTLVTISGTVTSTDGALVAGATVFVKGLAKGVATDSMGRYYISNVPKGGSLVVSALGQKTREVVIRNNTVNIQLEPTVSSLDETVVIAYGTSSKRMLTGAVGRITSKEIETQPVLNPLQAMQGRITGVQVIQNTGLPGGNFQVQVRGRGSIAAGSNPFYIVDGVPFTSTPLTGDFFSGAGGGLAASKSASPLNSINPADIESIEVLKDADATAIYGSRAANGVVLITTKKGKAGRTSVDVNVNTGWATVERTIQYLNTQQYLEMRREAFKNDGAEPQSYDYDLLEWDTTRYTNWEKYLLGGTAHTTNAQMSLTGGNSNTRFLMSGAYNRQTTVFPGDFAYQRGSSHLNLSHMAPDQKISVSLSANYSVEKNNSMRADLTGLTNLSPNLPPLFDAEGNWQKGVVGHPSVTLMQTYTGTTKTLIGSTLISYQVLPELQLKANLGYSSIHMEEQQLFPIRSFNISQSDTTGRSVFANSSTSTWIVEPQAVYQTRINNGQLEVLIGTTFQQDVTDKMEIQAFGYTSDILLKNIWAAAYTRVEGARHTQYRYHAVFARINYNWQEKYIMNLTGRRDGSSRFGPQTRFANFGAVGLAWIFSKERWMEEGWSFLSFGKLRASYGIAGNDQIADYGYLDTYTTLPVPYQGRTSLAPSRLFNPNYGWEINRKLEAALELGFMGDRILFTTSYYHNRSSNQLIDYPLPGITGFTSILRNRPALVQNTGVEFELNATAIKNRVLTWTAKIGVTIPRNKLVDFPDLNNSPYRFQYTIGKPLDIFRGYHFLGVDPQTGLYQVEDMNKDGAITYPEDFTYYKKSGIDFYGNLYNRLQYKGWALDLSFLFAKQMLENYLYDHRPGNGYINQPVTVLDRWRKPGDRAPIQRFTQSITSPAAEAYNFAADSDQRIQDASFIRLKNLSLAWQCPVKWAQKLHLQSGRLYIQGQNLVTITDYQGRDPENGNDIRTLPALRTVTAGIQLIF